MKLLLLIVMSLLLIRLAENVSVAHLTGNMKDNRIKLFKFARKVSDLRKKCGNLRKRMADMFRDAIKIRLTPNNNIGNGKNEGRKES